MSKLSKVIMIVGVLILLVGVVQVMSYSDARDRANSTGGFESLGVMLGWLMDSYQLLILNIFLTGVAVLASGYALHSQARPT